MSLLSNQHTFMYTHFFGLKEKPFTITPDPRYLYMSELHREALAHLLYGVDSDGCLILLTGDVGTGKTTVCRCFLEQLNDNTDTALIINPKLTAIELLETICDELNIQYDKDEKSIKSIIDRLNHYLLVSHSEGRATIVIIDEAQNLDLDVLEQLRLLTNLETDRHKLLKIVLLGQPELLDLLNREEVTQINQRITSRYHLQPLLHQNDLFNYVSHRLNIAGSHLDIFSPPALAYLFKISHGIPRLINIICDRALLGAYVEGNDHVNKKTMIQAVNEVMTPEKTKNRTSTVKNQPIKILKQILVGLLLIGIGGGGVMLLTHCLPSLSKINKNVALTPPPNTQQQSKSFDPADKKNHITPRLNNKIHYGNILSDTFSD